MKKNLTLVALALAVLATVAVSPAMAASPFRVEVPFDFVVPVLNPNDVLRFAIGPNGNVVAAESSFRTR